MHQHKPNRRAVLLIAACFAGLASYTGEAAAAEASDRTSQPRIERLLPELDRLVPSDARIEVIATGFQ